MNNLTLEERKALEIMQKNNFRGISKGNVMQLMSILDKVDPEVAKCIIAQIPEALRCVVEIEKSYAATIERGITSIDSSLASCYQTEDEIIKSLKEEIKKKGTTFEEKKYYYEQMDAAARRKEEKDSEHRETVIKVLKYGGEALLVGLGITACFFLGRADVKFPIRGGRL